MAPASRTPGRAAVGSTRRRRGGGGSGGKLDRLLSALNDPANMTAQLWMAGLLLLAEAALCLAIIRWVPCELRRRRRRRRCSLDCLHRLT